MNQNEIDYVKFLQECRTYIYEKEALKELEKRFVRYNTNHSHYENNNQRMDPLRRYRLLESHVMHVDRVFRDIEKTYGTKVAKMIRNKMVNFNLNKEIDATYQNCITYVLNKQKGVQYEKNHS